MIFNKRGSSGIGFILGFSVILVFIFIPIFMFLMERVALIIVADEIKYAVDQSFLGVYSAMGEDYSKQITDIDRIAFEGKFQKLLINNIKRGEGHMLKRMTNTRYAFEERFNESLNRKSTFVTFEVEIVLESFLNILQRQNKYELVWEKELPVNN